MAGRRRAGLVTAAMPCACRPALIACGRLAASPRIMSVKKTPSESTWAEFWKVWFMPPPAPRSPAGRLFITAARFGEAKSPMPMPASSRLPANAG